MKEKTSTSSRLSSGTMTISGWAVVTPPPTRMNGELLDIAVHRSGRGAGMDRRLFLDRTPRLGVGMRKPPDHRRTGAVPSFAGPAPP